MSEKRPVGRPPNAEPRGETVRVDFRIDPALKRRLLHAAVDANLGLGAWVTAAIEEKLRREEA